MQELFAEVGDLKRYSINYDRSGRSKVPPTVWRHMSSGFSFLFSFSFSCCSLLKEIWAFNQGTAEVVFSRRADAVAAVKKYNNVQLDGKPMKIEIVGTNISTPAVVPLAANGVPRMYILYTGYFFKSMSLLNLFSQVVFCFVYKKFYCVLHCLDYILK